MQQQRGRLVHLCASSLFSLHRFGGWKSWLARGFKNISCGLCTTSEYAFGCRCVYEIATPAYSCVNLSSSSPWTHGEPRWSSPSLSVPVCEKLDLKLCYWCWDLCVLCLFFCLEKLSPVRLREGFLPAGLCKLLEIKNYIISYHSDIQYFTPM